MFLGNAAIVFSGALGDTLCVSGALNQYYKQNKEKFIQQYQNQLKAVFPWIFLDQMVQ